ncbi:uncharacterized membrane protein YbhN (UPF0104 family) [Amycolatopsis bartoniae]|uniref:Flippase-like domain-containing protein n=1 Tax=Amycolatopsis bartoniae TaxID=941986 RepID=A0A8H9M7F0_9PSEU|nr:uncharacterized membrane protein YbhN (UPF0104 family) [Amycolatopsis bartoniae]GHF33239.1 hypothetical protein GCM10017566_02340 [Amycolatopsis bartoniae]
MFGKLWPWLRLTLAAALLGVLVWRLGTGAFLAGLRAVGVPAVLVALGIGLFTTVCSAWRWCLVARRLGLPLRLNTAVPDYYRALLLNAVLPAGVLGDVHRAVRHGHQSGHVGRGMRAVFLERLAGQVVLLAAAAGVLLFDPGPATTLVSGRMLLLGGGVVALGVAGFLAWAHWRGRMPGVRAAGAAVLEPGVALLSAVTLAGHVGLYLVAARAAGVTAPVAQLVPLIVLALLVMAVPVNIGGYGPREAFSAVAFGAAGLGAAAGVTTAVVYGVLTLVAALPGAVVLFRRGSGQQRQVLAERLDERREHVAALLRGRERRASEHTGLRVALQAHRQQVPTVVGD